MDNLYFLDSLDKQILINEEQKITKDLDGYSRVHFDLRESSVSMFLEEMITIPFLEVGKIVVVDDIFVLQDKSQKDNADYFINYLASPSPTTVLIINNSEKLDKTSTLYKNIKKHCIVRHFDIPSEDEYINYTVKYFKDAGYKFSSSLASEIVSRSQKSLSLLNNYLEELFIYKADEKEILFEDIDRIVSASLEDNVFLLVESVIQRDVAESYRVFYKLLESNVEPTVILSLLQNKFNEILQVNALMKSGYKKDNIESLFKVSSGRAYYMMKNSRNINDSYIKKQLVLLNKLESDIKSGYVNKKLGFEIYLSKI